MGLFDRAARALDDARKVLADAESVTARWEAERAAKTAERDDLAARMGDLVLDDPDAAARLGESLGRLNVEIDVAARAVLAASVRADRLRPALLRAEANVKRAEGKALETEGTRDAEATRATLDALCRREGVEFGVLPLQSPDGVVRGAGIVPPTRSQAKLAAAKARLREADELERRADAMEAAGSREHASTHA